ncbi:hypothetical protein ACWC3X_34650 [Streptomyces populi]
MVHGLYEPQVRGIEVEAGLLAQLPRRAVAQLLALVELPVRAWPSPMPVRAAAPGEQDLVAVANDHVEVDDGLRQCATHDSREQGELV